MLVLKTLIFTVFVPGTVTVFIPYRLLSSESAQAAVRIGILRYFGVVPILLGAWIYLRCAWDFAFTGKGTPAPVDPPKELVAQGLYRFVRNPMYVGVLCLLFGESWLFESKVLIEYTVVVFLLFHLFVVLYEEPSLRRKFGESYRKYCDTVPRWIPLRSVWTSPRTAISGTPSWKENTPAKSNSGRTQEKK